MKTAYEVNWLEHKITKVKVDDDWTEAWQQENCNYLIWATFQAAQNEMLTGLQAEIDELSMCTEEDYFA